MKLIILTLASYLLLSSSSFAAECLTIKNQGNSSFITNNCHYPVKLSFCKGNCRAQKPRAILRSGARQYVGTRQQTINYRWCYTTK